MSPKWERRFPETEFLKKHFVNIVDSIGERWKQHLNLPLFHYTHSEVHEFGTKLKAPCLILTGPTIEPSGDLGNGTITLDVLPTDGGGRQKTRTYNNIPFIDITWDITIVTMNPLDLVQYVISSVILFRSNAFIKVDGHRYKIWRVLYPSTSHVINHTNQSMAKGQFQLRGIPVIIPFDVEQGGRVYTLNTTIAELETAPDC